MLAGQRKDAWDAYIDALKQTLKNVQGGVIQTLPTKPSSQPPGNKGTRARVLRQQIEQAIKKANKSGFTQTGGSTTAPGTGSSAKQIEEIWKAYKRSLAYLIANLKRGSVPSTSPLPSAPTSGQPSRALARDIQKLIERDYPAAVQAARNIEAQRAAQDTITPPPSPTQPQDPQVPDDPYADAPPPSDFVMPPTDFQPPPGDFSMPPAGDTPITGGQVITAEDGTAPTPMSTRTKVILGVAAAAAIWYFWLRKRR